MEATRRYDGGVRRSEGFWAQLRFHVRAFFTNWSTYDAPVTTKLALALKNRTRALVSVRGCCGNHGEPGC
jgi:hypothetical protein